MDPYQKVQQGERLVIHAQAWNKMLDSISIPQRTGGELAGLEPAPNTVWIRNDSGQDVPRGGVLGVSGVAINPASGPTYEAEFARRPTLTGVTPNSGNIDRFVVVLEPTKNGSFGKAAASGVFACKVNVVKATHRFANAKAGDNTQLESASCGPVQLLWATPNTTGPNLWAVGVM